MEYRTLGRTGLRVSAVALGCEGFMNRPEEEVRADFDFAIENGINFLDLYASNPELRSSIGAALAGRREGFVIQGHLCSVWEEGQYLRTREPEKAQACFSSIRQELRALDLPVYHPSAGPDGAENSCICATWQDGSEVFTNNYCGESAQSIFTLLVAFAEETEAGIFSRPAPDGGWKCPECGMPNGSSVFCAECGARRPAE